jgi:hypothetical protein
LQGLEAVRVRQVGAAVDAVVGRSDEASVAAFRGAVPVSELQVDVLSLEEIFVVLCGDGAGGA